MMLPCPFSVQTIVPLDEDAPLTTAVPLEQIVWLPPADAVGAFTIVKVLLDTTLPHGALLVAVNLIVILPAAISAGLGE